MNFFTDETTSELFRSLVNGTGLGGLVQVASLYLENPIVLCDTNFTILEGSKNHNNQTDFELRNNKLSLNKNGIMTLYDKKIVSKLYKEHLPFISEREDWNTKFMFCSVRIKKSVVGYICVIGNIRPFSESDFHFVEIFSQMISLEMQKADIFTNKGGFKYEYFMSELLNGNFNDLESTIKIYSSLGRKPLDYYRIIVFSEHIDHSLNVSRHLIMEHLITIMSNSMVSYYKGKFVLLVSRKEKALFEHDEEARLINFLNMNQMRIGVSYEYTDILQTSVYYNQAKGLLDIQIKDCINPILYFEENCLKCLALHKQTLLQLDSIIHPDIKYLKAYDQINNTEYLPTLWAYLKNDRAVHKVSRFLNIHKSTYFYRMNKISELLQVDLNDSHKIFAYEISMRILELS